jgi:hypothetical protein
MRTDKAGTATRTTEGGAPRRRATRPAPGLDAAPRRPPRRYYVATGPVREPPLGRLGFRIR